MRTAQQKHIAERHCFHWRLWFVFGQMRGLTIAGRLRAQVADARVRFPQTIGRQRLRNFHPRMVWYWANVADGGPILSQHWVNEQWLPGFHFWKVNPCEHLSLAIGMTQHPVIYGCVAGVPLRGGAAGSRGILCALRDRLRWDGCRRAAFWKW